ncbi:hybrid sensor histidine kinase/response regulator [Dankookia rubra]|uniref:histidine kinase n=1 Tax=Dankookia rubra TaxID=1442381 RepID=A0A4R5QB23_9PROT|nr:response regulator [Dankookia rubra]TDH59768.1 hybrid sensor histidine kinase/response regulator [Dankookia rubra]
MLIALCPALLAGLFSTWQSAVAQRAAALDRLAEAATVLATALDREVAGLAGALDDLAGAAPPAGPAAAIRPLAGRPGLPVRLVGRDAAVSPDPAFAEVFRQVSAGVRPAFRRAPDGPAILVAVPLRDAEGGAALGVRLGGPPLRSLLAGPGLPPAADALLLDDRGSLVAASDVPAENAAALPTAPLGPLAGPLRVAGRDGQLWVLAQASIAAIPGWTLVVAQPAAALDAPVRRAVLAWGLGGLAAVLAAGLLALGLARGLRRSLRRLQAEADRLVAGTDPGTGTALPPRGVAVAELAALQGGLQAAAARLEARLTAAQAASAQAAALARQLAERDLALEQAEAARRAALRRREEVQAGLLQAQRLQALGAMAGRVAHEFNTALASIVGSYRLVARQTADPALLQAVQDGSRAAERAAALLRELVDFARREELRPAQLELPGLLAEVREMIHYTIGKGLSVVVELPPGLWPVVADPHRLEVALLNLAALARDGLPPGGSLLISARNLPPGQQPAGLRAGDYIAIAVRDAGGGLASEGRAAGHGLDLAMVRNFAEQSGGTCWIDRRPGAGTSVEILLPRADPEAAAMIPEESDALDPRLHGGAAILLVDTEEPARARQAALLRDLGYTVAEAGNAEAAESLAHWLASVDLLVTAMELPGADGASLAARLRAERPALPVLFLTVAPPGPVLAGELVLQRPVPPVALAEAVLELLQRRRSLRAPPPGMRLLRRLRTPSLRAAFLTWHAARVTGEALPRPANLDLARLELQEHCALVALDGPAEDLRFRFVSVGRALTDRLGHGLDGTPIGGTGEAAEVPGSLQAAYRRAARTRAPVFEAADFDFGEGPPLRFERLTLPLSQDGETVTHLIGVVLFHEDAAPGTGQAVEAG